MWVGSLKMPLELKHSRSILASSTSLGQTKVFDFSIRSSFLFLITVHSSSVVSGSVGTSAFFAVGSQPGPATFLSPGYSIPQNFTPRNLPE